MIETADARLIVADVLGADKSGPACYGIVRRERGQQVVSLAEPVDAVVGHAGHVGIGFSDGIDIIDTAFGLQTLGA